MSVCGVCARPASGEFHPACVAERLPQEVLVVAAAGLARLLVPAIVVWAA